MRLFKSALFLLLLVVRQEVSAIFKLKKVIEIADFWISTIGSLEFLVDVFRQPDKMPQEILNSVHEVSVQLDRLGIQLNQKLDMLAITLPKQIREEARFDRAVEDIVANIRDINYLYKTYYVNIFNATLSNHTLQAFVSKAISIDNDSPRKEIENIYTHFRAGETGVIKDSLLVTIIKVLEAKKRTRCDEFQSPQQWLYEVYSLITTVELRVLIMITSAYKIRSSSTGENFERDILSIKEQYVNRMSDYMTLMKAAFDLMPDDIRRCDPPSQVKESTYIELEKHSQIVIINAEQLTAGITCQDCESFTHRDPSSLRQTIMQSDFGSHCNSHISHCTTWSTETYWAPGFHKVEVCTMPQSSKRRYLYFVDSTGSVMGTKTSCPGQVITDIPYHICPKYSWMDWRSIRTCSDIICYHCFCNCIEASYSNSKVPTFDMGLQKTDCSANMVVTGIKLAKDASNVIRLQIKQGKLIAGGRILPESENWVPVNKALDTLSPSYERNGIALNDAMTPSSGQYVITGVQFYDSELQGKRIFALKIHANKFNVSTGIVDCQDSTEHTNALSANWREMDLSNSDTPLNSMLNVPDTTNENYIRFQPSSIKKDAGQTVIPFLDIQPVYSNPPSPLQGIGFYHKGAHGFGGYVALKIRTLNLGKFIDTERN